MFVLQSLFTLLLCCFTSVLCEVVFKDKVHRFIYENTPFIMLYGSGFEVEAKHLFLEIGAVGQELKRDEDYTVENLVGRGGLKINLLTQWVNFTELSSPESLFLRSVKYVGFTTNFLPNPVVIATVFRTPTLFPNDQMINRKPSKEWKRFRIYGKNLKGLEEVSLSFHKQTSSCGDFQNLVPIGSTMHVPLQDDFLTLDAIPRFDNMNNELRVYGICSSQMEYLSLNGNEGILVARFQ